MPGLDGPWSQPGSCLDCVLGERVAAWPGCPTPLISLVEIKKPKENKMLSPGMVISLAQASHPIRLALISTIYFLHVSKKIYFLHKIF